MHDILAFLTGFADQAVVLPVTFAVAATLAAFGWRRGALVWLGAVIGSIGLVVVLKLLFFSLYVYVPFGIHLKSPSGHTAAAVVVYGGLFALIAGQRWAGRHGMALALGFGLLVGGLIGFTRLELHAHSKAEVLVGMAVGLGGIAMLMRQAGAPPRAVHIPALAVPALAAMLLFHGGHLYGEQALIRLATALRGDVRDALDALHGS
jgi:membrane-associated phospholipid phosphatase